MKLIAASILALVVATPAVLAQTPLGLIVDIATAAIVRESLDD